MIAIVLRTIPLLALAGMVRVPVAASPELTGSWTLVLVDNILPDGSRVHLYGEKPEGLLVFDPDGRYALQIFSADRSKFAAGDKAKGSPEEYRAAVQGSNAHFGRWRVEGDSLIFQIDHASYPNWEGTEQKRPFRISGDELRYTVPTPTSGGGAAGPGPVTGEVVWRRAGKESKVTQRAKGEFDVKLTPMARDEKSGVQRMSLEKTFHGDLDATSVGEMLATGSAEGSGVYVAVERVTGKLAGREGGFALHHTGVMERGKPALTIAIVPDSGTGGLAGISGRLRIEITGGKHFYELEYTLPEKP
jgi:Protein of unknown function (DUF3224)/Lipocalin-like domain